jgi:hypothetical protein
VWSLLTKTIGNGQKTSTIQKNLYSICRGFITMSPSEKLLAWHGNWILSQTKVVCRNCKAEQPESDRTLKFPHISQCPRKGSLSNPWQELDGICNAVSDKPP